MVVLTIDDGINRNGYMAKIIDQNPGVPLSFFVNGENGASHPPGSSEFRSSIQNAVAKGHEVKNGFNG
jgi:hypothetical protein